MGNAQHQRAYRARHPERVQKAARKSSERRYWADPDTARADARARRRTIRLEMVSAYGGRCSCCGEDEEVFLTLEHINGDGAEHRRKLTAGRSKKTNACASNVVYLDLKRRGWPKDDYTILCANCQMAHRKLGPGRCPHATKEAVVAS